MYKYICEKTALWIQSQESGDGLIQILERDTERGLLRCFDSLTKNAGLSGFSSTDQPPGPTSSLHIKLYPP
jgi:hypothetical protein